MPARTIFCTPEACSLLHDLFEIASCRRNGNAPQTVVAAQFEQHDFGLQRGDRIDPAQASRGGVAADTQVDDAVPVALPVERLLEEVGIALPGIGAQPFGQAVAERDNGRTGIRLPCRLRRRDRRGVLSYIRVPRFSPRTSRVYEERQ